MVRVLVGDDDEFLLTVVDLVDLLELPDLTTHGLRLSVQLVGELPCLDSLKARVVVDSLLGIEADELSSDASGIKDQGVHHLGPSVDSGCETGRSCPYNDDIVAH